MTGIFDIGIDICALKWGGIIENTVDACFVPITGRIVSFVSGGLGKYFRSLMEMIWTELGG